MGADEITGDIAESVKSADIAVGGSRISFRYDLAKTGGPDCSGA